jgi:hypothetical protein
MKLPSHLHPARHYAALHPLPVEDLLRLAEGKPVKESLGVRLRRLWCSIVGHDLVIDRWHAKGDINWFENNRYEIHMGCRRCPHVQVLDPREVPEMR